MTEQNGAILRKAEFLISLYGLKQAREEARLRAAVARSYSSLLSAEYWQRVASEISART